jgi:hypothetical protein
MRRLYALNVLVSGRLVLVPGFPGAHDRRDDYDGEDDGDEDRKNDHGLS